MKLTENQIKAIIKEAVIKELSNPFDVDQRYTHFAVNKSTGKIVNGWDYTGYDQSELNADKNYYFFDDLRDYELDPKQYLIYKKETLLRKGIDPFDMQGSWANS